MKCFIHKMETLVRNKLEFVPNDMCSILRLFGFKCVLIVHRIV